MKDLLKRLKDENNHLLVQLGGKDEEIDRMKDEENQQEEVANDAHLESQLEDEQEIEPDPICEEVDQALVKDEGELIKNSENTGKMLQEIIKNR